MKRFRPYSAGFIFLYVLIAIAVVDAGYTLYGQVTGNINTYMANFSIFSYLVAAMGIAQKLLSLGNYIYQGFAAGTQPLMGYNYGAKNFPRMKAILRSGVMIVTCTELVLMVLYGAFAPFIVQTPRYGISFALSNMSAKTSNSKEPFFNTNSLSCSDCCISKIFI